MVEGDEDLVVDFRQKEGTELFSSHWRREPGPVRLVRPAVPGKADLDASQTARVAVFSNDGNRHAVDRVAVVRCWLWFARDVCAHSAPMLYQGC